MSNLTTYCKILSAATVSVPGSTVYIRCINTQQIKAKNNKTNTNGILTIPQVKKKKEESDNDKKKEGKFIQMNDFETPRTSMKDYPHGKWSWHNNPNKDDYELVKHIEILQKFADRYNSSDGNTGNSKSPMKADVKENTVKISINRPIIKEFSTYKGVDEKKSYSEGSKLVNGYTRTYITLADEPKAIEVKNLVKADPPEKKPILLYRLGLKNSDTPTKRKKPIVVRKAVNKSRIEESVKAKQAKKTGETVLSIKYKEHADRKPKIYPNYFKQVDKLLTRCYTTNNSSSIEQSKSYITNNLSYKFCVPVRTNAGRVKIDKRLPEIDELTMTDLYSDKNKKRQRLPKKPSKSALPVKKSPDLTKTLDNSLKEVRKVHGAVLDQEKVLTPSVYPKTSLLVKKSDLPIEKCKKMRESSPNIAGPTSYPTSCPRSCPRSYPTSYPRSCPTSQPNTHQVTKPTMMANSQSSPADKINQDSSSTKADVNSDRTEKQTDKNSIIQRIINFFSKNAS